MADLSIHFSVRRTFLETVAEEDLLSDVAATDPTPAFSIFSGDSDELEPASIANRLATDLRWAARAAKSCRLPVPCTQLMKLCAPMKQHLQQEDTIFNLGAFGSGVEMLREQRRETSVLKTPPLKSFGRADQLNNFAEFHFRMVKYGRYCHRTNPKSIRRFMNGLMLHSRMASGATPASTEVPKLAKLAHTAQVMSMPQLPQLPQLEQESSEELETPGGSTEESSGSDDPLRYQQQKNVDYIRLRYDRYDNYNPLLSQPGAPTALTMVAGARTHYPAHVDIAPEKEGTLEDHIKFTVKPSLPEGLTLRKSTGLITGIPLHAQDSPSLHNVTISIPAMGAGGISLGMLPLTTCTISVRIVDLRGYMLASASEKDEQGNQIVLRLRKC